jgi:hypothetical protein
MNNQEYQAYKSTVDKINKILGYQDDMRRVFSQNGLINIKKAFNILTEQMEKAAKDENIEPSTEEKSLVRSTVSLFREIVIEKPIAPIFRDLSATYLLLVFNWNQTFGKMPDIEKDIKLIDGIIRGQLTMLDAIRTLQILLEKTKKLQQYEPPSFNLSRAYLDNLKKEIENQKSKSGKPESKEKVKSKK